MYPFLPPPYADQLAVTMRFMCIIQIAVFPEVVIPILDFYFPIKKADA